MIIEDKIFLTTFDLFLKYGVKSVSMDDICRKIGISKKTIYTVINCKKDLVVVNKLKLTSNWFNRFRNSLICVYNYEEYT